MIRYQVKPISLEAHLFEVKLFLTESNPEGQTFYLPAWIRGSYMIRDFARHIVTLEAKSSVGEVEITKKDKHTWFVERSTGELQLTYVVYAWDLSVRGAHLDTKHAYFNGPCLFLAVSGRENEDCELQLSPPGGQRYGGWIVATSMPARQVDAQGFGRYVVPDYEALLDYPVEIGEMAQAEFLVNGKQHRFMVSGHQSSDLSRLCQDLKKVCGVHVSLFGELPVAHYLFLLWVVGDGYGGLEHRNSSSLMCSRDDLPRRQMTGVTEGYRRLLGLCSHEYFHLWNVKRIMPRVFQEASTKSEVYTKQLWVFEGITSYYDDLALVRSGVIDKKGYFELLAETITRVMRGAGRTKQTLEQSSFDAWTKFYKQDENAPNAIVSYYAKGALFALVLDLHVRLKTYNAKSLDSIMRYVWQHYGKTGKGLAEGEFEQIAGEVSGLDLKSLFDNGLRSTKNLPLKELLQAFGITLLLLPAVSSADKGRVLDAPPQFIEAKPVLGAKTTQQNQELKLLAVFEGGAAQKAGLAAGDTIVAINGLRLNEAQMEREIASSASGDCLRIHAFRRDELMEFDLIPLPAAADTGVIYQPKDVSQEQLSMQAAWLHLDEHPVQAH